MGHQGTIRGDQGIPRPTFAPGPPRHITELTALLCDERERCRSEKSGWSAAPLNYRPFVPEEVAPEGGDPRRPGKRCETVPFA